MTIEEANEFYKKDKREYIVSNNKTLSDFLNMKSKSGYYPYLSIKEMQKLINEITKWYEIKYPNREFDRQFGCYNVEFFDTVDISDELTFEQLLYRLSNRMYNFIRNPYRYKGAFCEREVIDGKEKFTSYSIVSINNEFDVIFNLADGFIKNTDELLDYLYDTDREVYDIVNYDTAFHEKFIKNANIHLTDLIKLFSEDELRDVNECLDTYQTDLIIRDYIFRLIALNILYSKNTSPEYGLYRSRLFVDEFNKALDVKIEFCEGDMCNSLEQFHFKVKKYESF